MSDPRVPGNEETLDAQFIYSTAEESGGQPRLVDGLYWPGYLRKWLYSRKVRPVALVASVEDMSTIKENWITGFNSFWNAVSSFTWSTVLTALTKYFTNRNTTDASLKETKTQIQTTSANAMTITCAAGHAYKLVYADLMNDTRAPQPLITHTPQGLTALESIFPAATVSESIPVLGGFGPSSTGFASGIAGPIWLQPADTFRIEDGNFVAADSMRFQAVIEDYTLG